MSKTGKPRRVFSTFVAESRADTIDVPDDDGSVLISLPQPHFWSARAKEHAVREEGPAMIRELVGDEQADRFFARSFELGLDEGQAAATLLAYLTAELGAETLGESSASSTS